MFCTLWETVLKILRNISVEKYYLCFTPEKNVLFCSQKYGCNGTASLFTVMHCSPNTTQIIIYGELNYGKLNLTTFVI